jgi:predicted deacylase
VKIRVGDAEARPGALVRGSFRVGSLADGTPLRLPVLIACGKLDGPRVWIEGCIHGEEYGGAAAIINFMHSLDPSRLGGTLIAVPVTNPASFNFRSRVSSIDGQNLNRVFPGNRNGSHSLQLAAALADAFEENADFLLDLHSGGIGIEVPFFVIYHDAGGREVDERSKWFAKRVGTDTIWRATEPDGFGGMVQAEALRRGIPALTLECGGGNFTETHMRNYRTAIEGFCCATGLMEGSPPVFDRYTLLSKGVFLHNREGGLFQRSCQLGDILEKGTLMARMIDVYGDIVEEIRCPADSGFVGALRVPYYPVHAGEIVGEIIQVEGYEDL